VGRAVTSENNNAGAVYYVMKGGGREEEGEKKITSPLISRCYTCIYYIYLYRY
jgi:hypothetical protein